MPTFYNLDNYDGEVTSYLTGLSAEIDAKWDTPLAEDNVADVAVTTDLTGVDTGTDMTAVQAAAIVADLTALAAFANGLKAVLVAHGLMEADA